MKYEMYKLKPNGRKVKIMQYKNYEWQIKEMTAGDMIELQNAMKVDGDGRILNLGDINMNKVNIRLCDVRLDGTPMLLTCEKIKTLPASVYNAMLASIVEYEEKERSEAKN